MKPRYSMFFPALLGAALVVGGCSDSTTTGNVNTEELISNYVNYNSEDYYTAWQGETFTKINLEGKTASFDGPGGVVIEGNKISLRTSGTYVIEGTIDDGQIIVDTEDKGTVRLVLNGVTINSSVSAPIYVKQADKTVISLEENTENTLSDAKEYVYDDKAKEEPNAAIFSNDDLTINGTGTLIVNGNSFDGIKSDDDLKITGGTIQVTATDDGLVGKDLFAMKDASISIVASGDGIKASNDKDESKGNVVLESGSLTIQAEGDGISAEKTVAITGGDYEIVAGGGSPETIEVTEEFGPPGGGPGGMGNMDISSMIDRMLEGIEVSPEVKKQLESAQNFEEIQTILAENPDLQEQIQNSFRAMGGGPRGMEENGEMPQMPNADSSMMPPGGQPIEEGQMGSREADVQNEDNSLKNDVANESTTTEDNAVSTKGIKSGTDLIIAGGSLNIDSLDDGIHSNGNISIYAGEATVNTGDDGLHADNEVVIAGGTISVEKSYEGLEGENVTISEGTIHLVAADDGININSAEVGFGMIGGEMPGGPIPGEVNTETAEETNETANSTTEEAKEGTLLIEGGYIYVNAAGDGLDLNNMIHMTDGTVIVYGPTNAMNGALDYGQGFTMEGGTLIAAGSSGMAEGISDDSKQNAVMMTFPEVQEAGTAVVLENNQGEQVIAVAPEKEFQTIVISTPELNSEDTFTLVSGGVLTGEVLDGLYNTTEYSNASLSVEFTMSNVMTYLNESGVTEKSSGMMGGFGGGPGGPGGMGGPNPFSPESNEEGNAKTQSE